MERQWWIAGGVLAALAVCCGLAVVLGAVGFLGYSTTRQVQPVAPVPPVLPPQPQPATVAPGQPTEPAAPATPDEATPEDATPAQPTPTIDPATLNMLAEIESQVTALRGLQPNGTFDLAFPTPEEYRQITTDDFEKNYSPEEAADDSRLYSVLGLVTPGFDLYNMYLDLYAEGVLGSYDQDTKKMYVLQASGKIGGVERQTYAHEYDHALQDQNYGIAALGLSDDGCQQDSERCSAISGLIEGDATLLETQWLDQYGTSQDYIDIADFYRNFTSPVYDRAPCYLRDDFYWPYDTGYQFVQGLYDAGGWAAVDKVYRNPPVDTEQIMHPDAYHSGDLPEVLPTPVLTETLGTGWRQFDAGVMGEWYTQLILMEPFRDHNPASPNYCIAPSADARQVERAAAGWGGDAYVGYYNADSDQTVFTLLTTWDTDADAGEFADAFGRYAEARFGEARDLGNGGQCRDAGDLGVSCLFQRESDTLWVVAPDGATLGKVVGQIPPFAGS